MSSLNLLIMMPFSNRISEVWLQRQIELLDKHIRVIATRDGYWADNSIDSIPTSPRINETNLFKRLLLKVIRLVQGRDGFNRARFHRYVNKHNINKILIHYADYAMQTQSLWQRLDVDVYVHVHGKDIDLNDATEQYPTDKVLHGQYHQALVALSSQVHLIANSNTSYDMLVALGINPDRIRIKHFGVPVQSAMTTKENEQKTLLFLGRLIDCKGPEQVIKAFNVVRDRGINARLIIAGDGDLYNECFTLRDASNYRKDIDLAGAVDQSQATELYQSADIFCAYHRKGPGTGRVETFGVTILEAMSHGLAVITGARGGPVDIISNGENGILVPENDFATYVDKLCLLCEDDMLRERLGKQAKMTAEQTYSPEQEYQQLMAIFEE